MCQIDIPNLPQSPNIAQNSDRSICNFWISGQSLIKKIIITPEPVMILTQNLVCKTYIFIKSNLLSYKNWKQSKTKKSLKQLSHYCFE